MTKNINAADVAAKTASVALHPMLLPVYCTLFVLYTPTPYAGMPVAINAFFLGAVGFFGSLMPLLIIGAFILLGVVGGVEMPTRSERVLPLLVTALAQGVAASLFPSLLPAPLLAVLVGEAAVLLVAGLWSLAWKVSIHAMGAGALLAVVTSVGVAYGQDFTVFAAASFVWAGVMAWARLHEKAHTPWQILAGYVAGAAVMGIALWLLLLRRMG